MDICLRLRLSSHDLAVLENFRGESSSESDLDSAHDVLTRAMQGAHRMGADDPSLQVLWLEEIVGVSVEKALQVCYLLSIDIFFCLTLCC